MAEIPLTQIVTLTINPAVDVSTSVRKMVPFTKMRCAEAHRDPGGGGINVARALTRLGLESTAIYPAGGATGQLLATLVEREGVRSIVIPAANDTREDLTIFDETTREQFRLVFPGAPLGDTEWQACLESLARVTPAPAFVIASGSLPAGALLITRDTVLRANGFPIEPLSVSGAGDSFLGAMVWSLANDASLEMALRYGVAGGSAALLNPGTELCRAEDVRRLASEVIVTPIDRKLR